MNQQKQKEFLENYEKLLREQLQRFEAQLQKELGEFFLQKVQEQMEGAMQYIAATRKRHEEVIAEVKTYDDFLRQILIESSKELENDNIRLYEKLINNFIQSHKPKSVEIDLVDFSEFLIK